jgi:hypothetical protein
LNTELMISYADCIGDSPKPRDTPSKQSAPEPVADTSEPIQNGGSVVTEAQAQAQAQASHEADISMSDVQDAQIDAPEPPTLPGEPLNTEAEVDGSAGTTNADSTAQPEQTPSTSQTPKLDNTIEITKETHPQKSRSPKDALQEAQSIVDPTVVDSTDPSSQKQRKSRSPPQADKTPVEESEGEQMIGKTNPSTSSQGSRIQKTRIPRAKSTTTDAFDANQPEEAAAVQPDRSHQETVPNTLDVTDVATEDTPVAQKPSETTKKTQGRKSRAENGGRAPAQAVEGKAPEAEVESRPEVIQSKAPSKEKRPRGRPSLSGKKNDGETQKDQGLKRPPEAGKDIEPGPSKPRRGRPSLSGEKADVKAQIHPETEPEAEPGPLKSRRGRPAKNKLATESEPTAPENQSNPEAELRPEPGQENAPEPSKSHRGRPRKKTTPTSEPGSTIPEEYPSTESEPRPESAEQEDRPEPSKPRRGRPGKKSKSAAEPESIALEEQPNNENEPRPEPDQEDEPAPTKARRGRTKKSRAAEEPETTTREVEAETETAQGRRKPREPRGETVPVTVHRLFNPSALGAMYTSAGSGDEDEESADELSTRQKTKLPNRGGVNPADVLSQICRETLEKTLTALNNGIANETNTQRRAEWTRKRRAVEAFGSELDGRLLDLSEMLDSNFVLGVQLRKTKREMMDLRSHLYKVRRERESIALQMDAVRGKHMEEENARKVSLVLDSISWTVH